MRGLRFVLPALMALWCPFAQSLFAQNAPAFEVHFGNSAARLGGPWKFTPGDSPRAGQSLLWASPSFDDSGWANMELHAVAGDTDAAFGDAEYVPGWNVLGYPRLVGYAWYRMRVHVADRAQLLWLKMPDHEDDAYQVYSNGKYVGEFGNFTAEGVDCYRSRPLIFALPPPDEHSDMLLAIRFYMEPWVIIGSSSGDSGGMHQAPMIGPFSQVEPIRAREHTGRILNVIVSIFVSGLLIIAAAGAFWIWLVDRPRRTFLWLALGLVLVAIPALNTTISFFTYAVTQSTANCLGAIFSAAGLACWIYFWRDWFELSKDKRLDLATAGLALVVALAQIPVEFSSHFAVSTILRGMEIAVVAKIALGLLLFVALARGARRDRTAAIVALPPILLLAVSQFTQELLAWSRIRTSIFVSGIHFRLEDCTLLVLVLVTGALAVRRFVGSQVAQRLERQTIDQEMEQARELQQHVLIPETIASPLFAVETSYRPARTVGGDFFQVIPHRDGSLLVVVGDVSGKGMAAAMLVAVLVGAIRTRAEQTSDPQEVLRTLNERMQGRSGGHFATCIVAHFDSGGTMRIANAGHLPPYRNGRAIDLQGSIPLGILRDSSYATASIPLASGDHIVFLTDGVVEARNDAGQLLGFDAAEKLCSTCADAIADAAILHGQDDDITVVGVRVSGVAAVVEHRS